MAFFVLGTNVLRVTARFVPGGSNPARGLDSAGGQTRTRAGTRELTLLSSLSGPSHGSSCTYLLTIFIRDPTCFFTPVTPESLAVRLHTANPKYILCERLKVLHSE